MTKSAVPATGRVKQAAARSGEDHAADSVAKRRVASWRQAVRKRKIESRCVVKRIQERGRCVTRTSAASVHGRIESLVKAAGNMALSG
jgi:hypothetical protein